MKRPKIVLVVTDKEQNSKLAAYKVDLLEIRVDLFKRQDVAYCLNQIKQRRLLKIPIILTIRNQKKVCIYPNCRK